MRKRNYAYCESCKHKEISRESGMMCGVSNKKPDFPENCRYFEFDRDKFIYAYNSLNGNRVLLDNRKRIIHYIIDTISQMFVAVFVFGVLLDLTNNLFVVLLGTLSFMYLGYFIIMEWYTSKTVGKLVTKSIVLDTKTLEKPKFSQVVIRSLFRLPLINTIDLLVSLGGTPLHDAASKTSVYLDDEELLSKARLLLSLKNENHEETSFLSS